MQGRRAVDRSDDERSAARGRALSDLALALAGASGARAQLELEVVRRAAELIGDAAALWRKDDDGHIDLVALSHWHPPTRAYMEERAVSATHSDTVGVLPHAWQLAEPLLLDREAVQQWLPLMQPVYVEYARKFGLVSLLLVPLRANGIVVGLLGLSRDVDPEHDAHDVAFVEQVAAVVATALQNERLLRQLRQQVAAHGRAEVAAERAGLHDPLTGLPNRRRLVSLLQTTAGRGDGEVVLVVLDVDDFKVLNASLGHEAGDEVLREVAQRLTQVLRQSSLDTATLARLGSDEFAVLVRGPAAGLPEAELVERLRSSTLEPVVVSGRTVKVRLRAGFVRGAATDAETLLRHAQVALTRAARDDVPWAAYVADQDAEAEALLQAVEELDVAVGGEQLQLAYQPVVRRGLAAGDAPHLVEALVRWHHPQRGVLLPAAFLPLVTRSGRMALLTRAVLRQALDDVQEWARLGQQVQVSINVTAATVSHPQFLPLVEQLLAERSLDPAVLCLELVESEVLSPAGPQLLADARRRGLKVAMDDFGTGYSSLAYLADLPLDRVKLDRSFVRRMAEGPRMAHFVGGLVDVVHRLGLQIVAEGIEQEADALRLDDLGVALQQGFWHARPQPALDLSVRWTADA